MLGKLNLIPPPSEQPAWLAEFLGWADEIKRLMVWGNADNPEDAGKARDLGATGIGLCRTEHMFMETNRLPIVQQMIIAEHARRARQPRWPSCSSSKRKTSSASSRRWPAIR